MANGWVDLGERVVDRLLLRTVPGAVDYLVEELRPLSGVTVVGRRRDAVVVDVDGPLATLAPVRYFTSCAVVLTGEPFAALTGSARTGALSAIAAPIRFRIGQLGDARWPLRDRLTEAGWVNEPGAWDVNVEPDGSGAGLAEIGGMFWTRRFGELLRMPASTTPVIAAVMTRLAKIAAEQTVLDPCCGAGTLLVSAGEMARPGLLIGGDHQQRWLTASRRNLAARRLPALLVRGDATRLPLSDGSVDRVVCNLPFGKRVGSHRGNQALYPALLGEIARLLPRDGRAVLLTEDKRLFTQSVQRTRGLRVIKEITFESGGAHPSAYVVTTRRGRRR